MRQKRKEEDKVLTEVGFMWIHPTSRGTFLLWEKGVAEGKGSFHWRKPSLLVKYSCEIKPIESQGEEGRDCMCKE